MKDWSNDAIKEDALAWLRGRFEAPKAEWVPGCPGIGALCPMALALAHAGYDGVWVGRSLIRYELPGLDGVETVRVRLPQRVALFPYRFDRGRYPDLVDIDLTRRYVPAHILEGLPQSLKYHIKVSARIGKVAELTAA